MQLQPMICVVTGLADLLKGFAGTGGRAAAAEEEEEGGTMKG